MTNIAFVPSPLAERAANSLVSRRSVKELKLEIFEVEDFRGVWLKLKQPQSALYKHGEVASPVITRELQKLGVSTGDHVLVALDPTVGSTLKVCLVAPVSSDNWHLAGQTLRPTYSKQQLILAV